MNTHGDILANMMADEAQHPYPPRARAMHRPDEQVPEMNENEAYQQGVLAQELRQG